MSFRDRLSVANNFSATHTEEQSVSPQMSNSASLAKAERKIKELQEENSKLKEELGETQSLYDQLVKDSSHEKYDERRVNMLKCQIVQLERQVLMLAEGLSSRSGMLLEVENHLTYLADTCRHYLENKTKIGEVSIPVSDLSKMVEMSESARMKLYKNIENGRIEKQTRPVILLDQFLRTQLSQPVTMLDVCSGTLEHINLKKVGKLESKLCKLYKQLLALNNCIHFVLVNGSEVPTSQISPEAVYARLGCHVTKSCDMLKDCTQDLLALSVLLPAAPWPSLQRPLLEEITIDHVMSALPSLPRSKQADVQHTIDALFKAINYQHLTLQLEIETLKEELKFHESLYELQRNYAESMFQVLREGYLSFEAEVNEVICKPMQEILKQYDQLKTTAGEDGLRDLLVALKNNSKQLQTAVDKLAVDSNSKTEGKEALSDFGNQFFSSLEKQKVDCARKRDSLAENLDEVKQQKEIYLSECKALIQHKREKKTATVTSPSSDTDSPVTASKTAASPESEEKPKTDNTQTPDAKSRMSTVRKSLKQTFNSKPETAGKTSKLAQPRKYAASPGSETVKASPKTGVSKLTPSRVSTDAKTRSGHSSDAAEGKSPSVTPKTLSYARRSGSLTKLSLKPVPRKDSPSGLD